MDNVENKVDSTATGDIGVEVFEAQIKPVSGIVMFWRELKADKAAMVALIIIIAVLLISVIGSAILTTEAVVDVNRARLMNRRMPPSWMEGGSPGNLLGTDEGGRDVLSFLVIASRNSLFLGFAVAVISIIIGIVIGIISGYFGGHIDNVLMRIVDTWAMVPGLMFTIALITMMTEFNMWRFIGILVMFSWMGRARLIRGMALQQSNLDYIHASKTLGSSHFKIIFKELMPNLVAIIAANVVLTMSTTIGVEVGLALLGYGMPVGTPSLGTFIAAAASLGNLQNRWWMWAPGIVLMFIMMMSINFVGQAITRIADPRQRRV